MWPRFHPSLTHTLEWLIFIINLCVSFSIHSYMLASFEVLRNFVFFHCHLWVSSRSFVFILFFLLAANIVPRHCMLVLISHLSNKMIWENCGSYGTKIGFVLSSVFRVYFILFACTPCFYNRILFYKKWIPYQCALTLACFPVTELSF